VILNDLELPRRGITRFGHVPEDYGSRLPAQRADAPHPAARALAGPGACPVLGPLSTPAMRRQ